MYIEERKKKFNNLWIEKYRPINLDEIIMDENKKRIFKQMIIQKEIPHILLAGNPGTGKTTLAFILINSILKDFEHSLLELNGSADRGINIARDIIIPFCKTPPGLNDKIKIVLIDEADKLTNDAQDALRHIIEKHSDTVRFIFTCNYLYKISDAIQSRMQIFKFKALPKEEAFKIMSNILNNENVSFKNEDLEKLIELTYPDIRKLINEIQKYILINMNDGLKYLTIKDNNGKFSMVELEIVEKIFYIWKNASQTDNINNVYHEILNYLTSEVIDYDVIYSMLFNRVTSIGLKAIVGKFANLHDKVKFPHMNLTTMIFEILMKILGGDN